MTITIQRGRQFAAGDSTSPIFDRTGNAGGYLAKAAEKLAGQGISLTLSDGQRDVTLSSLADYTAFIAANCGTKQAAAAFASKFGITFSDFANVVDDAAASDDTNLTLDLRPTGEVAKKLSLDSVDGDYAVGLAKGEPLNLSGGNTLAPATARAAGVPSIGRDILSTTISSSWQRDRTEMENWADFDYSRRNAEVFRELTGPAPYAKLTNPKWDDEEAMALVNEFEMPLHAEVSRTNPDGTIRYQDGSEMFRDTYFEDRNGALGKAGASVRARVRFDDDPPFAVNRVLVQAKEGRDVTGTDSAVRKFEKRWEGMGGAPTEDQLKEMLVTGKDRQSTSTGTAAPLEVAQKLYQLAQDKGTLAPDGLMQLEEKYTVLQKRRRTHLQLASVGEVQRRRAALQTEMTALTNTGSPIPPALSAYAAKLDTQIKVLTDAQTLLSKYGEWMPSGECFIVSADRYNVYDPTARKGKVPTDIGDDVGRIGRGPLHLEAEWDSASSDPFEQAIGEIDKRSAATTDAAAKAALEADKSSVEDLRRIFRRDVAKTVELVKRKLLAAGVREDPEKKSKEERAADLASSPTRPQFWF